jgi:hypothetical protein
VKIALIIGSDPQLEIAQEIGRELQRAAPHCSFWGISKRGISPRGLPPFDVEVLQRTFSRILMPVQDTDLSFARRLVIGILRRVSKQAADRLLRPRLKDCYPQIFSRGRLLSFDFALTLNDKGFPDLDLCRAWKQINVPVGLIQDSNRRADRVSGPNGPLWNGQGGCEIVYAWGQAGVDYYERAGVERARIIAVGNPRMDRLMQAAAELPTPEAIRKAEGLPADRPIVLLATNRAYAPNIAQPLPLAEYFHSLRCAIQWSHEIGAFTLVKPHINSAQDHRLWGVPGWVNSFPSACYRLDIPLTRAIKVCDAVLLFNSTVALEARLLGKPSGMLASDKYSHGVDFLQNGISRKVNSLEDLKALLSNSSEAMSDDKLRRYLAILGGSARAIVQDILQRCAPSTQVPKSVSIQATKAFQHLS